MDIPLGSSSSFLSTLIDLIPVYVYWKDARGGILGCNQMQASALGYDNKQDLIGKTDYDFYDKEKADVIYDNDMYIIKSQQITKREEKVVNYLGEQATVLSIKRPITLEDGSVGIAGISVDITELKKVQIDLIHARNSAEAAAEEKAVFMANMRHDFRLPLSNIISALELLGDPEELSSDDIVFSIEGIQSEAKKLQGLIESVVDFTRLKSGDCELVFSEFDLREITETVLDTLAPKANEKNIRLSLNYPDEQVHNVVGDAPCVTRILLHVIDNAIKFTDDGYVSVVVCESDKRSKQQSKVWLEINVEDSGIGMSTSELATVFEDFTRLQPTYKGEKSGLGLGLPIVKYYTELLGGELEVSSEPNKGTAVNILLPLERQSLQSTLLKWHTHSEYQKLNIMFLSDDTKESQAVQSQTNCQTVPSHLFLKALFELKQVSKSLDILIVDENITAVDFKQIPSMLKTLDHCLPLLLFITDAITIEYFETAKEHGYRGYFKRPIRPSRILAKLTEYWDSVVAA